MNVASGLVDQHLTFESTMTLLIVTLSHNPITVSALEEWLDDPYMYTCIFF
jgi:hypothetical protein